MGTYVGLCGHPGCLEETYESDGLGSCLNQACEKPFDLSACAGVTMGPVWGPAAVGAIVGVAYAALNRLGMKRIWRAPYSPLNVVVTGGTRGLGKAMAREFLKCVLNVSRFQ